MYDIVLERLKCDLLPVGPLEDALELVAAIPGVEALQESGPGSALVSDGDNKRKRQRTEVR